MAQPVGDDTAKKARRHTERVIKSLHPPTRTGKLIVWAAPYIVGPVVEYGVRFAEERGPELAGKGAAIAREKAPAVAAAVKQKTPVVARAAKTEAVAVAHTARTKAPEVAHAASEAAKARASRIAERMQERRAARRARRAQKEPS
jgi:hypothetical protein